MSVKYSIEMESYQGTGIMENDCKQHLRIGRIRALNGSGSLMNEVLIVRHDTGSQHNYLGWYDNSDHFTGIRHLKKLYGQGSMYFGLQ